jgi:tetratricopeptide (TPR) repeat protein
MRPDSSLAYNFRGDIYRDLNQLENAIADLSKTIQLDPNNGSAPYSRGHAYRGLRQWDKALADFSGLIGLYPHIGENWLSRGQTYHQMGQLDKAVADFSQAIQRSPTLNTAWMDRGRIYAKRGQWKEAAADFAQVVALVPEEPSYWLNHSCASLGAKDKKSYRSACVSMLDRFQETKDPVVASVVVTTCVTAPNSGADPAQLVALAKLACAENPEWNNGILGAAFYRANQPLAALDCFSKKGKRIPARPWDLLFMAMAHHRLGQTELSLQAFDRAVKWMAVADRSKEGNVNTALPAWESWQEQIGAHVLRGEAEALLNGKDQKLPDLR